MDQIIMNLNRNFYNFFEHKKYYAIC